ncbi:type I secretion C-terminal target domain (VC_A0849 subclass) [Meinhardsimonia xiamenensis]|jgi:hypothetical protein|uniref:Type I secretion C-terminal target domain (VC_A0849 subclass) n=1 Tax=Meinhardsimonia xiamenensis TaxID=990712 RepID=A0A1G8Y314_9RHOB|nr:hypothetical protein [Meinhardsimonia xiamenensis]PRX37147.1 putative secreted protein (type I secretion substrate) [Meinhardsimonia xiamenensis]SDJ97212.1 type I secretion C-terminal target domain (VC_A0849 subclass) [Meinhardsimonia xiamenensis]
MFYRVEHVATLGSGVPHMAGITDMAVWAGASGTFLYTGSEADGGLSAFALAPGAVAGYFDQIGASANRGTYGLSDLALAVIAGQPALIPAGRHDDRLAFHLPDGNGELGSVKILGGDSAVLGNLETVAVMEVQGSTFMVAGQWGRPGVELYRIRSDLTVEHRRGLEDTASAALGDVTDMATAEIDGRSYFFTVSAAENGISAWWMGRWGNVKLRGTLDDTSGLWVSAPTAVEAVVVAGQAYVVLAAAGSDSLTVMKMNRWGGLFVKDHEIDSLHTRFGGVSALAAFEAGGRSFLVAGGADDGLTLFEIAPGGRLVLHDVIADETFTTLDNVAAIEAHVFGSEVQLFVTSASEPGVTQFAIDLSTLGVMRTGGDAANTLAGTGADDLLFGNAGDDVLSGGGGRDILIDGTGVDSLSGGAGADLFVFYTDARMDTVTDFDPAEDRLDLSDFDGLHTFDQLALTQKDYGVLVTYGSERLRLIAESGQLLTGDISADHFIF